MSRSYTTLIFSLFILLFIFSGPGGEFAHTGARTNEGVAVCLMGHHVEVPGWQIDQTIDCERYER